CVAEREHVAVKCTRVDAVRMLLPEQRSVRRQRGQSRRRLTRLQRLASYEALRLSGRSEALSPGQEVRSAGSRCQAKVIGGALVREVVRQRSVHLKVRGRCENAAQHTQGI